MKNSKDYAEKINKLYKSLVRRYGKVKPVTYDEPSEALVYGIIGENLTQAETDAAIEKIAKGFTGLNDLRVSLTEEVAEAIGKDSPDARTAAVLVKSVLNIIFNKFHTFSTQSLKKSGKRPARQFLEKIEGVSIFAVDFCMLTALQGHAIPLTKKMIEFLKANQLVDPEADYAEIEGFLTRQVSAENAYSFYVLLRRESESPAPDAAADKTDKKKPAKASKPKTASKANKKTAG